MGKIYYLIGKSCTGKDTIYKNLLKKYDKRLNKVVLYTTRPIRSNEEDGREYHFTDEDNFKKLKSEGLVIEDRLYQTVYGPWRYFMVNDDALSDENKDFLVIGVLESYVSTRNFFGRDRVIPVYIDLDDGVRLQRALNREMTQENPKYKELCRRFIADSEDFSEEKLKEAGIVKRYVNDNLEECIHMIESDLGLESALRG